MSDARPRVFVTGATGLVGSALLERLGETDTEVLALSRRPDGAAARGVRWIEGDVTRAAAWQREVDGADAVVHLAGEPIAAQRWTPDVKASLRSSRLDGTRRVVEAIERAGQRPGVLVCASAAGYYGPRGEELLDESSPPGEDFLAGLCVDWEAEARAARPLGCRVVSLRFGMVLTSEGGALPRMVPPFRLGLGGPLGPADRFTPWIHVDDTVGLIRLALDQSAGLDGPLNAVAPEAVRMRDFARVLGRVLHRPAWLPVPETLLRLILGEAADAVVPGQHVVPRVAQAAGYAYEHPTLRGALEDLVG